MRKELVMILALALVVGLCWGASAQNYQENHYLVYQMSIEYPLDITVVLFDQFDEWFPDFTTDFLVMDKFANPVIKNGEPYYNEIVHQTWWRIDDPQGIKEVGLVNQFGNQTWDVGDGRYLVLPALKNMPGGDLPPWNHYKCYDAFGPDMDNQVVLIDQWGGPYTSVAVFPVLFCNPCIKELADGTRYEIENFLPHLAVYQLQQPIFSPNNAVASDQFGVWDIETVEAIWLVVPSEKLIVVENEATTWGGVKSLFR